MTKLFISHSSKDDAFVRDLRMALADHGQDAWIDSRELRGGDPLWSEIKKAIAEASAYAVVVSPDSLQSKWVSKELRHAIKLRKKRGKDKFPVIPLSLNGTQLGAFEDDFGEEPIFTSVSSDPGGVETAINALLVALGKRLNADVPAAEQPKSEPLEELVLELSDLKIDEKDGGGVSARARLVYQPATPGQPDVKSEQKWRLVAPIGPIEVEELCWYLEKYAIWPSHYFRDRARKVEQNLVKWGQLLYEAAMPVVHTANVMNAWGRIGDHADHRFSVYVDTSMDAGTSEAEEKTAKEAATLLLALPWELLHDGNGYLFQGVKSVRVRRRLPNFNVLAVPIVATPIRILLVTARPEDEACVYIDHRASALPLVHAMESLPGLVKIHVLSPPTLSALSTELERARNKRKPYHVVHFDGHGIFSREIGLGGLCFENPDDKSLLEKRRHVTVFTDELGPVLRNHRIPLVFLEACQTAQAEKASESVASELLKIGVASVVAMSHSVLVETARRFVQAFYEALADGKRIGDAMLTGQRALKDDSFRGQIFGAGELRLEDWFVPVLYQEKDDPQLFKVTPSKQTQEDFQARLIARLGDLPPVPETGFIGRSRELLALQRLLREEQYAVVRGQGGEGKTALAAEFARWMVRSQQIPRAAFVSVELHSNHRAVLDALGKQLLGKDFTAAGDIDEAIQQVERKLREQPALLVIDNMESVLLPPFMEQETPEALSEDARQELKLILTLCKRLLKARDTRIIFTSREALPAPFNGKRFRRELHQLDRDDAVKLVERVLNAAGGNAGTSSDAAREKIEQLVDAVHCHARTLALLAPSLQNHGIEATRESLVELMEDMEKKFPGKREKSLFASVELSLRRMSEANQNRARVLCVFHGRMNLAIVRLMTEWEKADLEFLAADLIQTGLATPVNPYGYLTLNPALCPYLRRTMDPTERDHFTAVWVKEMRGFVNFLLKEYEKNTELAVTCTLLELPNLFALLDLVRRTNDATATISLATSLHVLLQMLGHQRLVERIGQIRDAAEAQLGDGWDHAHFTAASMRIEQQSGSGQLREALAGSQQLLDRARMAGENAYPDADYDLAMACNLIGDLLLHAGYSEQAVPLLDEARERFEIFETKNPGRGAARMAAVCLARKGDCFLFQGRIDEAAAIYEESILRSEKLSDERQIAVLKTRLGTIRSNQGRYAEALVAHNEGRERFIRLNEPESVAVSWDAIGIVHQNTGEPEKAEDAYRQSLAIKVRLGNLGGQADTLNLLGNLCRSIGRHEEAARFYRQAIQKNLEVGDQENEGKARCNLAITLRQLGQLNEARTELYRAIEDLASFGHSSAPWKYWTALSDIETDAGNADVAAEAKHKAIACFLAYRRNNGENHDPDGRVSLAVTQYLLAGDAATATSLLQELAGESGLPNSARCFIGALKEIVAGSRDRTLADAPDLDYGMAAEILLLIETLEQRR